MRDRSGRAWLVERRHANAMQLEIKDGAGMFSRIRSRLTYVNVVVTLALVFAMSGGALAASKYLITSTKQIKPSVLASLKGAAGKTGPAGPQGPVGPAGAAGASVKGENGTNGKEGPQGKEGPKGATGPTGATGPKGATGVTGPEGVCSTTNCTLPSGATETGVWTAQTYSIKEGEEQLSGLSFPIRLVKAPKKAYFCTRIETKKALGECENTLNIVEVVTGTGCTGTLAEPTAPAGVLCIYTKTELNISTKLLQIIGPEGGLNASGVIFDFTSEPGVSAEKPAAAHMVGTFAVTAE